MGLELIELVPIFMVFILYFLGMPIVYALFGSTFFYFTFIDTTSKNWLILQKVMTSTQSFSMLAIPFFVMAGSVMNYGGISDKMMDFAEVLTGHMKGGLAQVNVVLSMLMGGCSGSANADCAMQSKMLVPEMEKRGYSKAFSAAITAASSAATPVIPPGVNLIVFTLIAQISLGRTFAAGYIPGILMAISMMIVVSIIAHKRNYPTTREKFPALKEIVKQGITSFWGLFFPFGIILGMRFGMFTPSEGGAVAVLYCIIIGRFVYKKLSLREHLVPILLDSIAGTSSVVLIMVAANVFGYYMTWINLPRVVATLKQQFNLPENVKIILGGYSLAGQNDNQQVAVPYGMQRNPSDYGYVPGRRCGSDDHHASAASGCKTAWNQRLPLWTGSDRKHHDRRYHTSVRFDDVHDLRYHGMPDQ